jgi:heptose I phosphotransferase
VGGKDPFVAVEALEGEVFRELEGRRTLRTEVAGRGYFVKIHHGIGWAEMLKNLLSLRLPVLGAQNEWRAIQRLRELGVDSMRAVAYGQRGHNPARRRSFLVTEELAPTVSLEDYSLDWVATSPARSPEARADHPWPRWRGECTRAASIIVTSTSVIFFSISIRRRQQRGCGLSLIDLHRAQVRASTPRRWRDKDLAALYFSALDIGLTSRDLLRFLAAYFARPLRHVLSEETALLSGLASEALRLQARFARKSAAGEMT